MSKLADARGLNMCLAWREHICLCDRIVILGMSRHNVKLQLTAYKGSFRKLNLHMMKPDDSLRLALSI